MEALHEGLLHAGDPAVHAGLIADLTSGGLRDVFQEILDTRALLREMASTGVYRHPASGAVRLPIAAAVIPTPHGPHRLRLVSNMWPAAGGRPDAAAGTHLEHVHGHGRVSVSYAVTGATLKFEYAPVALVRRADGKVG